MKFDKFGRMVRGSSNVQTFNGLSPELVGEFTSLGVETSSLGVIVDMVSVEDSGKAFEIILKIAKSQNPEFPISGRNF
jgi:hypothetical protein